MAYARRAVDSTNQIGGVNTDRGYTTHQHLDDLGPIHMNGRVYDPAIGRFMSADPGVPHPENMQSFKRYAYNATTRSLLSR
jgi:RHS repeat-associated protein